ncbi:hypothetical protein Nepgr_032086 [Nepenthes gracilis]|uniref:Uncharacterized protein n=1 Tax=Nepenthes gracilis TaxID=150966 RepID=A0AAD3THZ3_NEPGR|nr:hypothetical protein Nepgr_032086 [Nepenthes gracilis]
MKEELQECEIVFCDLDSHQSGEIDGMGGFCCYSGELKQRRRRRRRRKMVKKKQSSSAPLNIPRKIFRENLQNDEFSELVDDDGKMVPPHVIVSRRFAGKIACSVCSDDGRKLKGMNLCRVRNSILRITGFLD